MSWVCESSSIFMTWSKVHYAVLELFKQQISSRDLLLQHTAGPSLFPQSASTVSLVSCSVSHISFVKSAEDVSLTAIKTLPHIILITLGMLPTWTIGGEAQGGNKPQPPKAWVAATDVTYNTWQHNWSQMEQFSVPLPWNSFITWRSMRARMTR